MGVRRSAQRQADTLGGAEERVAADTPRVYAVRDPQSFRPWPVSFGHLAPHIPSLLDPG